MYAQLIGKMLADPKGAAEIGPGPVAGPANTSLGWLGKTGAKWHLSNTSRHDQSLSEKDGVATYKNHGLQSQ